MQPNLKWTTLLSPPGDAGRYPADVPIARNSRHTEHGVRSIVTNEKKFGPQGWTSDRLKSLAGRTYVITGANAGAGFEATRVFLSKGANVVMLNRNAEKSTAAIESLKQELGAGAEVTFFQMDLAVLDSVRKGAAEVLEKVPQLDALICNAAIAQVAKQDLTVDGFESQLGVNHFGHFLLTGLLFERIERSTGRIVVVGSNAYRMGLKKIQFQDLNFDNDYSAWNAYAQSKLAQMMFAYELQRRVEATGKNVTVQVCHPGASRTRLIRGNANLMTKLLATLLSPLAQSAEKGSWPEVMCAAEEAVESRKLYGPTRRSEMVGPIDECSLDDCVMDVEQATRLWTLSEQKTSLTWAP